MKKPKVAIHPGANLLDDDSEEEVPGSGPESILIWVGLAFLVVGGSDFLLTWVPLDFGNPEWEFATLTAALNGLPVPLLGLAGVLAAAEIIGQKWMAGLVLFSSVCFLLLVGSGVVLWTMSIPLALQAVPPELAIGLKKALLKTAVQAVVYPLLLAFISLRAVGTLKGRG